MQAGDTARDLGAATAPAPLATPLPQARNYVRAMANAQAVHHAAIGQLSDYFFAAQQGLERLSQQLLDHDATHAAAFGG